MGFSITKLNQGYVIYVLTFLIVLPMLYRNSPHSIYFVGWSTQEIIKKGIDANDVRFTEASQYLSGLSMTQPELSMTHFNSRKPPT